MFSWPFTSEGFSFYREYRNLLDTLRQSIIYLVRNRTGYRDIVTSLPIVPFHMRSGSWVHSSLRTLDKNRHALRKMTADAVSKETLTLQPIGAIYFAKGDSKADGPYCFMYLKIARELILSNVFKQSI